MEIIYIASQNKGKIKEFETFFKKYNISVKSLLDIDKAIDIEETGNSFEENAMIKAKYLMNKINMPVLADDSGLEVKALNNEPGIYSARYAGVDKDDYANNMKLLNNLKNVPLEKRQAQFVCSLVLVYPNGKNIIVRGICKGLIINELRGNNGFGYDPLFYLPELKKTFAELSKAEKEAFSHRGNALRKLEQYFHE